MRYLAGIVLLMLSFAGYGNPSFSVLFVNPSTVDEPFWTKVEAVMKVAAEQNNVNLDVIYGEGNRYVQLVELKKYLQYRATPDYVILLNYPGYAEQTMNLLEQYGVDFITLEQTIFAAERDAIKEPKERYKHWLGEIYHDNFKAGRLLAKSLIDSAQAQQQPVNIVAINGHYGSESDARNKGLQDYLTAHGLTLSQAVHANWSKQEAMNKTSLLLKRYPETTIIWSASDLMALGAHSAVKQLRKENTQHPFFIGGFDWLKDNLSLIEQGQLTASVGGHYMMGGWALITLVDKHNGHRFWRDNTKIEIELDVITKQNVADYSWLIGMHDWSVIDFDDYRLANTSKTHYNFDIKSLRKPVIEGAL